MLVAESSEHRFHHLNLGALVIDNFLRERAQFRVTCPFGIAFQNPLSHMNRIIVVVDHRFEEGDVVVFSMRHPCIC